MLLTLGQCILAKTTQKKRGASPPPSAADVAEDPEGSFRRLAAALRMAKCSMQNLLNEDQGLVVQIRQL